MADVVGSGIHDDAVEKRAVRVDLSAAEGRSVIAAYLAQQSGDGFRFHNSASVYPEGGAVGILGGLTRHIHELSHFGVGVRSGGGFKGEIPLREHITTVVVGGNIVLVAVNHQCENTAAFCGNLRAVRQGDSADIGGRGGTVDGIVCGGGGFYVICPIGDAFDGGTFSYLLQRRLLRRGGFRLSGSGFRGGGLLSRCARFRGRSLHLSFRWIGFCRGSRAGRFSAGGKAQNQTHCQGDGQPFLHFKIFSFPSLQSGLSSLYHPQRECQRKIERNRTVIRCSLCSHQPFGAEQKFSRHDSAGKAKRMEECLRATPHNCVFGF